jgi:hypothetical protein
MALLALWTEMTPKLAVEATLWVATHPRTTVVAMVEWLATMYTSSPSGQATVLVLGLVMGVLLGRLLGVGAPSVPKLDVPLTELEAAVTLDGEIYVRSRHKPSVDMGGREMASGQRERPSERCREGQGSSADDRAARSHGGAANVVRTQTPGERMPGGYVPCYDPGTMQTLGNMPAMNAREVRARIARAKAAQVTWAASSFDQRRQLLRIILRYILDHQEDICRCRGPAVLLSQCWESPQCAASLHVPSHPSICLASVLSEARTSGETDANPLFVGGLLEAAAAGLEPGGQSWSDILVWCCLASSVRSPPSLWGRWLRKHRLPAASTARSRGRLTLSSGAQGGGA